MDDKAIKEKKVLELLYTKAPNAASYDLIISKSGYSKEDVDEVLESLMSKGVLVNNFSETNRSKVIKAITERRKSYYIKELPESFPIQEHIIVGSRKLPRLLDGDKLRAEDVNGIIEALVDFVNSTNDQIDKRVQEETAKIYRQMIGIFGVFVSIFAVIVISTDKMIRFTPEVLSKSWLSLLGQSTALFIPVGIVIGGLVLITLRHKR